MYESELIYIQYKRKILMLIVNSGIHYIDKSIMCPFSDALIPETISIL